MWPEEVKKLSTCLNSSHYNPIMDGFLEEERKLAKRKFEGASKQGGPGVDTTNDRAVGWNSSNAAGTRTDGQRTQAHAGTWPIVGHLVPWLLQAGSPHVFGNLLLHRRRHSGALRSHVGGLDHRSGLKGNAFNTMIGHQYKRSSMACHFSCSQHRLWCMPRGILLCWRITCSPPKRYTLYLSGI